MPPPRMIESTFSMSFSMMVILVETFEPPMMAQNGRRGCSITPSMAFSSFSMT